MRLWPWSEIRHWKDQQKQAAALAAAYHEENDRLQKQLDESQDTALYFMRKMQQAINQGDRLKTQLARFPKRDPNTGRFTERIT